MPKALAILNLTRQRYQFEATRITAISVAISTLLSADLEVILVAIMLVFCCLCDFKSPRFRFAILASKFLPRPNLSGTELAILNRESGDSLIFLSLPFWKKQGKPPKKPRIFSRCRTPRILGKEEKTLKKTRKFLATKKARKSKKTRKGRSGFRIARFESCDSKVALSIDRMRFGWRFWIGVPRFYFGRIRLVFASRCGILAIPGPRFWESCDSRSRLCAAKDQTWNMFGTSLHTSCCKQTIALRTAERMQDSASVSRPLRTIASHELLHDLLQQMTTSAATPLAQSTRSPNS